MQCISVTNTNTYCCQTSKYRDKYKYKYKFLNVLKWLNAITNLFDPKSVYYIISYFLVVIVLSMVVKIMILSSQLRDGWEQMPTIVSVLAD